MAVQVFSAISQHRIHLREIHESSLRRNSRLHTLITHNDIGENCTASQWKKEISFNNRCNDLKRTPNTSAHQKIWIAISNTKHTACAIANWQRNLKNRFYSTSNRAMSLSPRAKPCRRKKKKRPPRAFEVARTALASQHYATSRLGLQQRTQRRLLARKNLPDVLKARMPRCLQPGRASKLKPRAY